MRVSLSAADRVGSAVLELFEFTGALASFGARVAVDAFRPPYEAREIARHVYQFGYRSAPLILTAGAAIGVVLSMHTRASLERFGAEAMIPAGLAIALIRETGPLTAGLLVSGRVGAGIGAEIGAMKVTEQIDALEANAVDAFKYLAVTRVIALMIAMPLLTLMMDFSGIFGGYLAETAVSGMSWRLYFERAFTFISYSDLIPATIKTIVFGYLIAVAASFLGFNASRGTEGVGEASTRSVVMGSMLIILSDVVLVKIIFFFYPPVSGMSAIRFEGVSKRFGTLTVLDDVSFEIQSGTAFCLLGRSGTGKSVTLRHIVGLVQPDRGRVFVEDRDITALRGRELGGVRTHMGFLFQNAALFDSMSVGDNVAFPMRRHTKLLRSRHPTAGEEEAGGRRARLGLRYDAGRAVRRHEEACRARPRDGADRPILLVDEPSAGLDPITAQEIDDLLVETKRGGTTLVVVTHNIPSARVIGDDFAVLHQGRMLVHGTLTELDASPEPLVQAFMRSQGGGYMVNPARLVGIGVFVLGGLILFTVGLFMIGDRQMAFAKKVNYFYTEFRKITGLQPGGIVRVSGAKAGAIQKIIPAGRPGGKFRVQFDITEELHPLVRLDSIASIETEGLVGGNYLGVGSGTDASPAAAAGATIGSKEPFEIAELMQQMSDTIVKVNVTIQTVNDSIDEMKADVQRAVVSGADTIDVAHQLLLDVSGDVKAMAANGARLSADAAQIGETIRKGQGSLGKLINDDELYVRATSVAKQADEIAAGARQVVEQAKATLAGFQSKDGPVEGMAAGLKQTMDDARKAMSAFAENMEALKHNFLVRGFFKDRGFFNLADISPAAYRQGALTKGGLTRSSSIWLKAGGLFEPAPNDPTTERLTKDGRSQLDAAIGPFLDRGSTAVLVIEGYAQTGSKNELYLQSRVRASLVRDYFLDKFGLTPQTVGVMPLGKESAGSPNGEPWDGVALAMFDDKNAAKAKGR